MKPKIKSDLLGRKRRLITKDGNEIDQQNLYSNKIQSASECKKPAPPAIIVDDEHVLASSRNEGEEAKAISIDESKKLDQYEIFGLFVANEMKSLSSVVLQKKLKRKILECILTITDEQDLQMSSS